jgi:hypothetical protein
MDYNRAMSAEIHVLDVVKWAGLVFLAGFIGFFGKYLGRLVLSMVQRRAHPPVDEAAPVKGQAEVLRQGPAPPEGEGSRDTRDKALKKAIKAREKAIKKLGK